MSNYVTHEDMNETLRRALEAMREQEDLGASYRWGLNAALNTLDATLPQQPEPQPIDPLSPAAFVGRTTPDGKPVRWVAWGNKGACCEDSTEHAPERWPNGSLKSSPFETYNLRIDLANPARAGQTLWVGQGPDPREQALPVDHDPTNVRRGPVEVYPSSTALNPVPRPLTLADIPAELRAEIEAAERERVAQELQEAHCTVAAGYIRALGPREVKP